MAADSSPATGKKVALVAVDPIDHDGTRYELGEDLTVTAEQAAALVSSGAARKAQGGKTAKPAAEVSPDA